MTLYVALGKILLIKAELLKAVADEAHLIGIIVNDKIARVTDAVGLAP